MSGARVLTDVGNLLEQSYDGSENLSVDQAGAWYVEPSNPTANGPLGTVAQVPDDRWKRENREAFGYADKFIERNGIPLGRFRKF